MTNCVERVWFETLAEIGSLIKLNNYNFFFQKQNPKKINNKSKQIKYLIYGITPNLINIIIHSCTQQMTAQGQSEQQTIGGCWYSRHGPVSSPSKRHIYQDHIFTCCRNQTITAVHHGLLGRNPFLHVFIKYITTTSLSLNFLFTTSPRILPPLRFSWRPPIYNLYCR